MELLHFWLYLMFSVLIIIVAASVIGTNPNKHDVPWYWWLILVIGIVATAIVIILRVMTPKTSSWEDPRYINREYNREDGRYYAEDSKDTNLNTRRVAYNGEIWARANKPYAMSEESRQVIAI